MFLLSKIWKCEEKRKKLKKELAQKRALLKSTSLANEPEEKVKIDEDDPDKVI